MKNILLIYNPKAGDTTFRFSLDRFIEIFSEKGYEVRVFRSRVPGDMAEYIQKKQRAPGRPLLNLSKSLTEFTPAGVNTF